MTIQSTWRAVCNGCHAAGPQQITRVLAWTAARDAGWTLTRQTVEHWCPRCTAGAAVVDAAERAEVSQVLEALPSAAAPAATVPFGFATGGPVTVRSTTGGPRV